MRRSFVSLVLMPCVLLTQSAVLGHSHPGGQPAGHDLRPHFHTGSSTEHRCSHDHHHHGPGGHHHHHDDCDDDESDTNLQGLSQTAPASDHDADAVYVVSLVTVVAERSRQTEKSAGCPRPIAASISPTIPGDVPSDQFVTWSQPPPSRDSSCPLYVRHLALLI